MTLPSSKAADVLAPTSAEGQSSKITSMFALQQEGGLRTAPTVLIEDRFPCAWVEWKVREC
jgi:hypothetical protein